MELISAIIFYVNRKCLVKFKFTSSLLDFNWKKSFKKNNKLGMEFLGYITGVLNYIKLSTHEIKNFKLIRKI